MKLTDVRMMAETLIEQHGLDGWSFDFDRAVKRLGQTVYSKRQITISRTHALNDGAKSVRDTILHEIAHVLAGPRAGHGAEWKRIARRIGATPESHGASAHAAAQREADVDAALAKAFSVPKPYTFDSINDIAHGQRIVINGLARGHAGKVLVMMRRRRTRIQAVDPRTRTVYVMQPMLVRPHVDGESLTWAFGTPSMAAA